MRALNARCLFACGALVLLANGAYGRESYRRTDDRKTLIWNNYPKSATAATWSGERDEDQYATGRGTITWYAVDRARLTGFHLPFAKYRFLSRYSGKMVRGKFDGMVVKVDENGKTSHARFVEGRKTKDWKGGPAPLPAEQPAEQVRRDVVASAEPEMKPPALAAGPSSTPREKASQVVPGPGVKPTPSPAMDDSLRSLISPPSLLRMKAVAEASPKASIPPRTSSPPPGGPRLSATEVIDLADAEARTQGYDLGEYQRPQAHYAATDGTWSVSYGQKYVDGMGEVGTPFSVTVDDKTKKTSVVPGN
jgi:hypothetical protein